MQKSIRFNLDIYGKDRYDTLRQDLYGQICLPIQMVFLFFELSQTNKDAAGGTFILTLQNPRRKSRPLD